METSTSFFSTTLDASRISISRGRPFAANPVRMQRYNRTDPIYASPRVGSGQIPEIAIGGTAATQVYEGNRAFDLTVRFPEDQRNSVEKLADVLVGTSDGIGIPLSQLADIALQEGPVEISRDNGTRCMGIELNIVGRDIGSFVAEAQNRIREKIALPVGYSIAWGGQFENQQHAMRRLMIITPLVVVLVLVLPTLYDWFDPHGKPSDVSAESNGTPI